MGLWIHMYLNTSVVMLYKKRNNLKDIYSSHEVSILSTNADIFTVTLVSFFLITALYIRGSIVDNGGVSSGLLQTTGFELERGNEDIFNCNSV